MRLAPFDELNVLGKKLTEMKERRSINEEDILDFIIDLYILSYLNGIHDGNDDLGTDIEADTGKMREALYKKISGKDFKDRIDEYSRTEDINAILKATETDMTRIYNTAVNDLAEQAEEADEISAERVWATMEDDKVRDTHSFLSGLTPEADGYFYTFDGDRARFPGDFENAANNVNCRCFIKLRRKQ